MITETRWPPNWDALKAGEVCPFCTAGRIEEDEYGVRIFAGAVSDAYLQRVAPLPGFTILVWRGRHVAGIADLSEDEASAYARELLRVTRALDGQFRPAQINHLTLGMMMPHLHTNIVPRYTWDRSPGRPIDLSGGTRVPAEQFEAQVRELRARLG